MTQDKGPGPEPGAPPCMAAAIAPDYFDPLAVDAAQARDVARWRKARRAELLGQRTALGVMELRGVADGIGAALDALLAGMQVDPAGKTVSGYWPIKSEPDLRPWLGRLQDRGARLALPVVEVPAQPLVFRPWQPGAPMQRGHWNIPVPVTADHVTPDIALVPLVGWDDQGYRLGFGGGYFDRTLARIRPLTIGVGLHSARLASIYPQPHDIALAAIVTEAGIAYAPP